MSEQTEKQDTRSPEEIGLSSLAYARDYAGNVGKVTDKVAELLRGSRIQEANELFAQALDALQVLIFTIDASVDLFEEELQAHCPAAQREADAWVPLLVEAQQNQDWVRVADVLEYDVRPSLDSWATSLAAVPGVTGQ